MVFYASKGALVGCLGGDHWTGLWTGLLNKTVGQDDWF